MDTNSVSSIEEQAKAAWDGAVALLSRTTTPQKARTLFGRLLKQYAVQAHELLPAVQAAERVGTQDPYSYLVKAAQGVMDTKIDPALKASWT